MMSNTGFIGLLVSVFFSSSVWLYESTPSQEDICSFELNNDIHSLELNKENFLKVCEYYDVHHETIVYAQALLESGHFKSNVFKTRNNFLGLWNSREKKYYEFEHWTDCIKGYRDLVQTKYTDGDYYKFLDELPYAQSKHYTETVRKIERQYALK